MPCNDRLPHLARAASIVAFAGLLAMAQPALAFPELITNGDFSQYTVGGNVSNQSYIVAGGQTSGGSGAVLNGWGNTGYTFVFQPNNVASPGAVVNSTTNLALWSPDGQTSSTYSANGLTASPTGGAFLAEDGAYQQGYIYQTLNNLTVGQTYNLSFNWAAAQQSGYSGITTEGWNVYWVDSGVNVIKSFATDTVTTASHGFTPWRQQLYQVVATTTTMSLGFMATGGPNGTPPFSLLDSVSLTSAPEPATWAVLVASLVGMTLFRLRRRGSRAVA